MNKDNLKLNETFDLALKNHQKPNLFRVPLNYSFKYEILKHLKNIGIIWVIIIHQLL